MTQRIAERRRDMCDKEQALDPRRQAMRCAAVTDMLGGSAAYGGGDSPLRADWIKTPVGLMVAIADRHALQILEFIERPALETEIRVLRAATGCRIDRGRFDIMDQLDSGLAAYFSGRGGLPAIRSADFGTPFQKQVWQALRAIPMGRTQSYSGLAQQLGRPAAVRAVARANGANRVAVLIPCHRLLGADGNLTGYGGGLWRKDWLLRHEKRYAVKGSPLPGLQPDLI